MARRKPQAQLTPGQIAKAKAAYENGATFGEIAERHGVSESHARKRLQEAGTTPRPRGTAWRARRGLFAFVGSTMWLLVEVI